MSAKADEIMFFFFWRFTYMNLRKKKNFFYVILKNRRPHAYSYGDIQYNSI